VRFIRSDLRINIFGEVFAAPPETQYEYVVATIDVKEQKLKLFWTSSRLKNTNIECVNPWKVARARKTLISRV
jgi:hypothetical protein